MDLYRAVNIADLATDGRNIVGRALTLERVYAVSDPGVGRYREAHHRASFNKTIRDRGPDGRWPLLLHHPFMPGATTDVEPRGATRYFADGDALGFEARASRTRAGDEALELVNDGALRSVSIGFRPVAYKRARDTTGDYVLRTETALRELSLAATGFGVYDDGAVLEVRAGAGGSDLELERADGGRPRLEALARRRRLLMLP